MRGRQPDFILGIQHLRNYHDQMHTAQKEDFKDLLSVVMWDIQKVVPAQYSFCIK